MMIFDRPVERHALIAGRLSLAVESKHARVHSFFADLHEQGARLLNLFRLKGGLAATAGRDDEFKVGKISGELAPPTPAAFRFSRPSSL